MIELARFEALLRRAAELGAEVRIVSMINQHYGDVEFYAHIDGHDSDTVDICIDNGPQLGFLELNRGAGGLRGPDCVELSKKASNFTRQPLK